MDLVGNHKADRFSRCVAMALKFTKCTSVCFLAFFSSRKQVRVTTALYTPLLYSKTEVYRGILFVLTFARKHRFSVLVRTASLRRFKRVPTINVLSKNNKNIKKKNHLKMNIFTAVKYCCILHGRVFVMLTFVT